MMASMQVPKCSSNKTGRTSCRVEYAPAIAPWTRPSAIQVEEESESESEDEEVIHTTPGAFHVSGRQSVLIPSSYNNDLVTIADHAVHQKQDAGEVDDAVAVVASGDDDVEERGTVEMLLQLQRRSQRKLLEAQAEEAQVQMVEDDHPQSPSKIQYALAVAPWTRPLAVAVDDDENDEAEQEDHTTPGAFHIAGRNSVAQGNEEEHRHHDLMYFADQITFPEGKMDSEEAANIIAEGEEEVGTVELLKQLQRRSKRKLV
jgi:hypothetical protein